LNFVNDNTQIQNTEDFCIAQNLDKDLLDPVLKSLTAEEYLTLTVIEKKLIELTEEGQSYAKDGSPEFQFVSKMQMDEQADMAEMGIRCGA
jgi:hypothetical protein